jgi:serine/threonine protein kinase
MPEDSIVGTELESRYLIERELGEGGMGRVYAALDKQLRRRVAVKFIREADDDSARARFVREARAAASVSHPNACQLYEVGEHDNRPFLVMELLEGETLSSRLERGPMPADEVATLMGALMSAVAALHHEGLVHRDIKPSNVFLTPQGLKLLDFGLARRAENQDAVTATLLTRPGAVTGTMRHMAPEQVTGDPIDSRTDIFSLGVVLFEMVTGRLPFHAETNMDWLDAVLKAEPPVLEDPRLEHLNPVIARALQRRPQDRYATVEEMAEALQAAVSGVDTPPTASTPAAAVSKGASASESEERSETLSAVVMPFRVIQEDRDLTALRDVLPEALTAQLSTNSALEIVSNRLAEAQNEAADFAALGKTLGVDRLLTGSLLRGDDEIGVTVQWIDASDGRVCWSQTLQYGVANLLELQNLISKDVADALPIG